MLRQNGVIYILISDWLVGGARPGFAELDACVPGSTYIVDLGTTF